MESRPDRATADTGVSHLMAKHSLRVGSCCTRLALDFLLEDLILLWFPSGASDFKIEKAQNITIQNKSY